MTVAGGSRQEQPRTAPGSAARIGRRVIFGGDAVRDGERAATVLMHARSHVRVGRGDVADDAVRCAPDENIPPALVRASFEPIDVVAVEHGAAPPDFTVRTVPDRLKRLGDLWAALRRGPGVDVSRVA